MAALTVSPQVQGQGDGERILKRVEQRARRAGPGQYLRADDPHHALVHQAGFRAGRSGLACPRRANANTTGTGARRYWSRNWPEPISRFSQQRRHCIRGDQHGKHCSMRVSEKEAEGLDFAPYPGELGKRIYASVSKEAWAAWMKHQTMLVNENRLNLADQRARQYLARQMENFFFGAGAEQPSGYVAQPRSYRVEIPSYLIDRSAWDRLGKLEFIQGIRRGDTAGIAGPARSARAADRSHQETGARRRDRESPRADGRIWPDRRRPDVAERPQGEENQVSGNKVAAKYRNASTGESWSGRGLQPRWLKAALATRTQAERLRGVDRAAGRRLRSPRRSPERPVWAGVGQSRGRRSHRLDCRDPARLRPGAPVPRRHRRDRRPPGRAEEAPGSTQGPVPVPRREVAELHRHPDAPDLPLLRLRRRTATRSAS